MRLVLSSVFLRRVNQSLSLLQLLRISSQEPQRMSSHPPHQQLLRRPSVCIWGPKTLDTRVFITPNITLLSCNNPICGTF